MFKALGLYIREMDRGRRGREKIRGKRENGKIQWRRRKITGSRKQSEEER